VRAAVGKTEPISARPNTLGYRCGRQCNRCSVYHAKISFAGQYFSFSPITEARASGSNNSVVLALGERLFLLEKQGGWQGAHVLIN